MVLVFLSSLFFFFSPSQAFSEGLTIVEVQIAGDKTTNDFVKIYNPDSKTLDVSGYKLRKRNSEGNESSIRVFAKKTSIPAKSFFVWANSEFNYHLPIGADIWSKVNLSKDNSVALLNPSGEIIDALAWGKSSEPFVRGNPFTENPMSNQKLKRKSNNGIYQDTNDNNQDFELSPLPAPALNQKNTLKEKGLAAVGKQIEEKNSSFLKIFLFALTVSIFSAIIFLIVKNKTKGRLLTGLTS